MKRRVVVEMMVACGIVGGCQQGGEATRRGPIDVGVVVELLALGG